MNEEGDGTDEAAAAAASLSNVVGGNSNFTSALEENQNVDDVRERLLKERKTIKIQIKQRLTKFSEDNNGREPTKFERESLCKDLFKKYKQVNFQISSVLGCHLFRRQKAMI